MHFPQELPSFGAVQSRPTGARDEKGLGKTCSATAAFLGLLTLPGSIETSLIRAWEDSVRMELSKGKDEHADRV